MSKKYVPPPITTGLGQVVNNKRAQQQRNFAMQPTQLNKGQQWLRDNPPNTMGVVDELKSMLNPGNMTGANAIMDAFTAPGLSTTKRITTGLTGVAQGLGFAAGGAGGKSAVEGVANTGIPARIGNKIRGESVMVVGTKSDDIFTGINKSGWDNWAPNPLVKGDILPTVPGVVKPPQTIHPALKDTPVRWGWDPAKSGTRADLVESVSEYSDRWYGQSNQKIIPYGDAGATRIEFGGWTTPEIAVTKVPTKSLTPEPVMPSWQMNDAQAAAVHKVSEGTGPVNDPLFRKGGVVSTSPAKVVSSVSPVIKDLDTLGFKYSARKSPAQIEAELVKAIKRAGGKVPRK